MKKLLLLLLIAPIIGSSQVGNIFPTEIAEIIYLSDGTYYDIPQGFVFQPIVMKEGGVNVYKNDSGYYKVDEIGGRGLIDGGYTVKGTTDFFSGILHNLDSYNHNLIFEIDTEFESEQTLTVPSGKYWYLLSFRTFNIPDGSYSFGVLPENFEVKLNSTSNFCCDSNGDGVFDEIDNDINGDGIIDENDKYIDSHHIVAIEIDIASFNESLSSANYPKMNDIIFYPNPTSSLLALNSDKEYDIEVYDMAGNKVIALTGNTIDMSHLSSATYIVKALDKVDNEEVSYKVVKN